MQADRLKNRSFYKGLPELEALFALTCQTSPLDAGVPPPSILQIRNIIRTANANRGFQAYPRRIA